MRRRIGRGGRPLLVLVLILMAGPVPAGAAENENEGSSIVTDFKEHLYTRLSVLSYGTIQDAADSTQNPGYAFLDLPGYQADLEVRPDLYADWDSLQASIKPRFRARWRYWDQGDRAGDTDWDSEGYVNEWLVRLGLSASLFVSYGRENLQWGPSYLLSPSNPFFDDNGRGNPKQEVAGMDFARMVWLPDGAWSMSLIANTDPGRQPIDPDDFEPTYALKVDYTGQATYGGMVLSLRKDDRARLGFYAGVTASDALLVYGEASLARGTASLYPVADESGVFGITLAPTLDDSAEVQSLALIGGAYTLEMGPTLNLEYVYNSSGYDDRQAALFYQLRENAAEAFEAGGPGRGPAAGVLARTADPGLRLWRRHYLMLQFSHNDIGGALNLVLRWTRNLDDHGSQLLAISEYFIGDHLNLFAVGTVNLGGGDTEFGSFAAQQWMVGVQYVF